MKIALIITFSILSGICYRLGGRGKDGSWLDCITHSKVRDIGCAVVQLAAMLTIGIQASIWAYLIMTAITVIMVTTYHDWTGNDNFFLHGFCIGLASMVLLGTVNIYMIIVRSLMMGLFMWVWCLYNENDVLEEFGRGAAIIFTIPILVV